MARHALRTEINDLFTRPRITIKRHAEVYQGVGEYDRNSIRNLMYSTYMHASDLERFEKLVFRAGHWLEIIEHPFKNEEERWI